jgi:hypothetical protein
MTLFRSNRETGMNLLCIEAQIPRRCIYGIIPGFQDSDSRCIYVLIRLFRSTKLFQ